MPRLWQNNRELSRTSRSIRRHQTKQVKHAALRAISHWLARRRDGRGYCRRLFGIRAVSATELVSPVRRSAGHVPDSQRDERYLQLAIFDRWVGGTHVSGE